MQSAALLRMARTVRGDFSQFLQSSELRRGVLAGAGGAQSYCGAAACVCVPCTQSCALDTPVTARGARAPGPCPAPRSLPARRLPAPVRK